MANNIPEATCTATIRQGGMSRDLLVTVNIELIIFPSKRFRCLAVV